MPLITDGDLQHLISVDDINHALITSIVANAKTLKHMRISGERWRYLSERHKNKLLLSDFFEPSTRTRFSFEAAMIYLGGNVIGSENASEFSSFAKGESLADNFRVISSYCDIIVGRFKNEGEARIAADASLVPLINGGDGKGEHPTQALIDIFTIMENFVNSEPHKLTVTFFGDNRRSRTVQSLARLLASLNFAGQFNFISPRELHPEPEFLDDLRVRNKYIKIGVFLPDDIAPILQISDIVYVTRSQIERGGSLYNPLIVFTPELAEILPSYAIIMHPLPRNSELSTSIDTNPRARYFQQAHNALFVRMALLDIILDN